METKNTGISTKQIAAQLAAFSAPLILSGILQQLYNWVDAFVVGNVNGETSLAAVGGTTSIINFYLLAITGFTLGLAILFAQRYGSGDTEDYPKILSTFSILLGAVFLAAAIIGIFFAPALLRLMNTPEDIFSLALNYLQIIFLGIPFLAVYNVYSAALRGLGDSRAPFFAVLISSVVNVVLDILLVAVLGWNVTGAAIATVASQIAMTVYLILYGSRKYALLCIHIKDGLFDRAVLIAGLRLGLPPTVQSCVNAFGNLILQNFMNGFGSQTVAAITTAYRVDSIVILPILNLGSGISTLTAQSYGAGDSARSRRILAVGTVLMTGVSLLMPFLVIPMGGHLIALFGASAATVEIGRDFFRHFAVFYIFYGLANAIRGHIEGIGDVVYSSMAGIAALLCRIFISYTCVSLFGTTVIAYAEGFSWILLMLLFLFRFLWKFPVK